MRNALIIGGVIVFLFLLGGCGYNSMVNKREAVNKAWGDVESSYQRRADLIDNLVNTVKGAANFEKSTLVEVVDARAKATSVQLNANDLTQENIDKFQAAQDQLKGAFSRLLLTVEQYPELKATENFKELQAQLEGTENRINKARNDFNAAAQDYNAYTAGFPQVLLARMFGFTPRAYFKSAEGAEKAPAVKF